MMNEKSAEVIAKAILILAGVIPNPPEGELPRLVERTWHAVALERK